MKGEVSKHPPLKYKLWLFRMYQNGDIVPLTAVNSITRGKRDWSVANVHMGRFNNENRTVIALLAGPRAQYMLDYWSNAARRQNKVIDDWKIDRDAKDIYLPTFDQDLLRVMDVIECDRVEVPVKP